MSELYCFLLLNNIPLPGETTFYLSIQQLVDICVVCTSGLLFSAWFTKKGQPINQFVSFLNILVVVIHFGVFNLRSELRVRMKLRQRIRTHARRVRDMSGSKGSEFGSQIWLYSQISDVEKKKLYKKTGLDNLISESVSQRIIISWDRVVKPGEPKS